MRPLEWFIASYEGRDLEETGPGSLPADDQDPPQRSVSVSFTVAVRESGTRKVFRARDVPAPGLSLPASEARVPEHGPFRRLGTHPGRARSRRTHRRTQRAPGSCSFRQCHRTGARTGPDGGNRRLHGLRQRPPEGLRHVERQLYDRLTQPAAETRERTEPVVRSVPADSTLPGTIRHTEVPAPYEAMQALWNGQNCTILYSDVVAFSSRDRNDGDRLAIRRALLDMTLVALRGIPGAWSQDRGDGLLTVVPPSVPTAEVIALLHKELPDALDRHNIPAWMKLLGGLGPYPYYFFPTGVTDPPRAPLAVR